MRSLAFAFLKGESALDLKIKKYWPIFVLPTLVAFCIGFLWPFAQGFYLSFFKFQTINKRSFNGLNNYLFAIKDPEFFHALWFTALFTVVSAVVINVCAFAIALALTKNLRGTNLYRSVYFMPNLIGGIVLGYIWNILLNGILSNLGLHLLQLYAPYGFIGLLILMSWQQIGYMMIIYIAGLQAISPSYLEAARIDGATEGQILWRIKIPNVMPSITICLFLTLTNGFKLFDQNLALTGGDPSRQTEMLALNIFNNFYGRPGPQWRGYAQAKAVLFCILVIAISLLQLRATRSREVQQ